MADSSDACPGYDDAVDVDADGIPDGCDTLIDSDGDGVSDADDACPGHDDAIDVDEDDIPDGCDSLLDIDDGGGAEGTVCQNGDTKLADDGCNQCICNNNEWACTEVDCGGDDEGFLPAPSLAAAIAAVAVIALRRRR